MAQIEIVSGEFNGMSCLWLSNGQVKLAVTTDRGPRIVFWGWQDGENLFAELPDAVLDNPDGPFHLLGGHRLWYAPEVLNRTYWPDDLPLSVEKFSGGATFTAPVDGARIVKTITVELSADLPEVKVTHHLKNEGRWAVELAPWGISMCKLGGIALLPQPRERTDPSGFLPNRLFSFWPYSNVADSRLVLGNHITLIKAEPGPNSKIGYRNVHGWFAYWINGTLLAKYIDPSKPGQYPDGGCNVECYFSQDVIELETLHPLVQLEPGSQVSHDERWHLHKVDEAPRTEADAGKLADALKL